MERAQAEHDTQMSIAAQEFEELLRGTPWIADLEQRIIGMSFEVGESGDGASGRSDRTGVRAS
jgi:hypothetical protein